MHLQKLLRVLTKMILMNINTQFALPALNICLAIRIHSYYLEKMNIHFKIK